eukprot:413100_1
MALATIIERKKYELFMNGYIRSLSLTPNTCIPKPLQRLILTFYPALIRYNGVFIKQNCGNNISMQSEHQISGCFSAKLDKPLPIETNSESYIHNVKYQWKLQITGGVIERKNWYFIGVVSNRCTNFNTFAISTNTRLIDSYGITLLENNVSLGYITKDVEYDKAPQINQIIIVEYGVSSDQSMRKLQIFVEERNRIKSKIYSLTLPTHPDINCWYPVFSKPNNSTKITLLPSD